MTTTVSLPRIKVDDSILTSLKKSKDDLVTDMKFYTASVLYKKGQLSLGKAALLAGLDKNSFINKLGSENIAIFDFNKDELLEIESDSSF